MSTTQIVLIALLLLLALGLFLRAVFGGGKMLGKFFDRRGERREDGP